MGHYTDLFDQFSTTALAARNFGIAREEEHKNIAALCATCYAILKKSANILNKKDNIRKEVNKIFDASKISHLKYNLEDMDSRNNIFHVAEILYNKTDKIRDLVELDLSGFRVAAHHACHYCKVHHKDTIGNERDPMVLETLAKVCGVETVNWYDGKTVTCGNGFRQRYMNKELSLSVTAEKLTSLKDNEVDILLHMCPNCQLQFDRSQKVIEKSLGREFNIICLNISQFLALALGAHPYKVAGIQTHTVPVESFLNKFKTN